MYSGGLWFLFIVEILPSGWGWTISLSTFPGQGSLHRWSGRSSWISSLWSAVGGPVMSFEMGLCVRCDFGQPYVDTQGYVPALLENLCGMSCSKTYWLLGGGWFQCMYGAFEWSLIT